MEMVAEDVVSLLPPTDDELLEKFRALANDRVGADATQQMEDICWNMHMLDSAKIIQELLTQ